ncbi:coiled-coil domain-containing protein 39-like [Thrips palmi]|uniref:Coiled-coil domain-containing protein 39 n=1 Tax=Thrips palmi TaxID=161013 RepID=A0A6P8Y9E5_THRPL|nr:coiled-coil domain-containing protein 39-like [Thrips palmi]
MVREITEILKQLGWTDGFRIPVSNEENRKLENLLEAKVKEKAQLVADIEEMDERLDALNRHLSNISHEQKENHKLLTATRQQVDTSQHMTTVTRNEHEGLQRDLRNMKTTLKEKTKKISSMEAETKVVQNKVTKLKQLMHWDGEELLAWEDLHNRKEEDIYLLQQFINEDTAQFKDLEMKRVALQTEVDKQNALAEEATTEAAMLEQVFDRVAQLYRQAHSDHQALIHQWEHSVQAMHLKDKDINDTLNEILAVRSQGRVKMAELLEVKELDANLKNNNAEAQSKAEETHRKLNILRNEDQTVQKDVHELENELNVLKRTLSGLEIQLSQQRSHNTQTKREVNERKGKIEALELHFDNLIKKQEEVSKNLWDAGERYKHMEKLVQDEEHLQECFLRDINKLQSIYFRTTQELQSIREKERLQSAELQTLQKNKKGIMAHIETVEKEIIKIKNATYEMEFSEQKMRSRISHALGETRSAEQDEMLRKIEQLECVLREKQSVMSLLTSQVNRLENDCRQMSNVIGATAREVEQLQWKRQDGLLLVEGGKKQLKAAKAAHHETLVEHALLRVKVNQVERALHREGTYVHSLSKQRLEWENAMKERKLEIDLHKEMMASKRKTLNEEKSQLQTALNQLNTRRSQLQNRHDIITSVIGKDEYGDFISPAMLKLKIAQEKIMLQDEGDILDAKIKKAEKEIEAMENTLKVVNTSNDTYRKNLTMIDKEGPEGEELRTLEQEYYQAMVSLRAQREQRAQMESEIQEILRKLSSTQEKVETNNATARELENDASVLVKDLQDQEIKLHRADGQLKRLVRELRSKSDSTMFGMEEKDIALRELIDRNQAALELLAEMSIRHMEAAPIISQHLREKGLSLPQPGQHLKGVASMSTLSGASSARSGRSSSTSVSSCTYARRRIFDPHNQPLGSYHGTLQTPAQLDFPLKEDTCCAPHSSFTLGSMSETRSQSDAGGSVAGPIPCFEGTRTFRSREVSADDGSQNMGSLVEVHPAFSGPALTASTEASQTSIKVKTGSPVGSQVSGSRQARLSQESSKKDKPKSPENDLQSTIIVGSLQLSASGKPKSQDGQSLAGSRSSSRASTQSGGKTSRGSHSSGVSKTHKSSSGSQQESTGKEQKHERGSTSGSSRK